MDTHVIRVHFTDGSDALSGMIEGDAPDLVDATFARDVNRGWQPGRGAVMPDGRIVRELRAELVTEAAQAAA